MTKDEKQQLQRHRLMGNRAYQAMQGLTRYRPLSVLGHDFPR